MRKENQVNLVLNLQNERGKFVDTFDQHINNPTSIADNLMSKLVQVESSLVVTKTVHSELLK